MDNKLKFANFPKQVIGIGNAIIDLSIKISNNDFAKLNQQMQVLSRGSMSLVDLQQLADILSFKSSFYSTAGGSVANSLKIIASTGVESAFIGSVAGDDLGKKFATSLANYNCQFYNYCPKESAEKHSAVCAVLIDDDSERTMATYLGCAGQLANSSLDFGVDTVFSNRERKIFYLEGYLWDNQETIATIDNWLVQIKQRQDLLAFSLSDNFCVKRKKQDFLKIISTQADIIFANHLEMMSLLDLEYFSINNIAEFCNSFPHKLFAVTCGSEGSYIFYGNQFLHSPAVANVNVVDLTGAGDAFAAGLIFGLVSNYDIAKASKIANVFASRVIAKFGSELEPEVINAIY